MTYDQFWYGDVWLAADYYRANQLSIQRRSEEMWLQGLYNFAAVSIAVGNAMRRKGAKARNYPQKPLRLIPYTEAEKAALAEQERQRTIAYFTKMQKEWERAKCRSAKC
ncbi:hypothetical protein B5E80_15145 [Flavonifractor sp. An135]|nr:hypothetical protein [Flavonifractor sp. An135]OUQ22133.1 hypothetical protein B5E80_15145 [Flavonifractor sp. An135]